MSFGNFSPLFLSACICAWVRINKVAVESACPGLKEVLLLSQGKTNTVAHLHLCHYTNSCEATADSYQEKNQDKQHKEVCRRSFVSRLCL